MICHTRIIILRAIDYQESSKILTVFSAEHGKIALIARGAKKPRNKFAGKLDVGTMLDVVYYYKGSRGVQTLTEANVFYRSDVFRKDFERAAVLYATLELVGQLVHEHEVNLQVYAFAQNFIEWLGEAEETYPSVFAYVQLRLADITGIGMRCFVEEPIDGEQPELYLNVSSGEVAEESDSELSYKLSAAQSRFVMQALKSSSKEIFKIPLQNGELKQLVHHIDVYFKYHIEGYKERRSDSIFEQMLQS